MYQVVMITRNSLKCSKTAEPTAGRAWSTPVASDYNL